MKTLMNWLANLATGRPKTIILLFSLLTVGAIFGASRLDSTFRMRALYDYPGNKEVEELDRYNEEFGDDGGFAVVVIESKEIFTPPVLRYIQKISRALKRKPQFRRIISLSLNTIPRGHGDEIVTGPLFESVPEDRETLERIRKTALSSRVAVPRLVSADGRYALVGAEFKKPVNQLTAEELESGNAAVKEVLETTPKPAGVRTVLGGTSFAEAAGPRVMENDQKVFLPVGLVLIILVIILSFGSWHGVVLTFAEVILTLAWTFGFMGLAGLSVNLMSASTPTILMVYGLLDSVFVMAMFYRIYEGEQGKEVGIKEATRETISRMGPACLLTSVSTAIGFASYAVGVLPMIQMFGLGLAVGVIFAFISSIIWMPALVCVLPAPKRKGMRKSPINRMIGGLLVRLGGFTRRRRWVIIGTSLVIFAVSVFILLTRTYISIYTLKELPQKDMEGIEGINLVADHLVGACSTGVQITGKPGSMQDPKLFKAMDELDRWAEQQGLVTSSLSPSDLIRDMHRAFNGGSKKFDAVPDDRGLISQYLALLDPPTRSDFITDDYARTHVRIMTKDVGSYRWRHEVYEPLVKKARELFKGYELEFPGYMKAIAWGSELATRQMVVGFLIAFAVIAILVGIAFRSARLALLSLLPNLLPTTVAMAAMVLTGQSLRVSTVMFLSVAVGITFDNSIHLFSSMREGLSRGMSREQALEFTLGEMGPPIVFTSVLIAAGLGIFMLSSFGILFVLGMTSAIVVMVAAVADLLLTTALLGQWGHLAGRRETAGDESNG